MELSLFAIARGHPVLVRGDVFADRVEEVVATHITHELEVLAHCGHGGTCNMVAARVHRLYKGMGKPRVYCGPMPSVLTGGRKPSIPLPSEEELNETDGDGDDDFDFDDDDDDDDDDAKKKKKKDEPSVDDF